MDSNIKYKKVTFLLIFVMPILYTGTTNKGLYSYIEAKESINSVVTITNDPIDDLLKKIICKDWDEIQKVTAIFDWIATNIKYDQEGNNNGYWKSYSLDNDIAIETFNLQKGICSGYAFLFKVMCERIGIEAVVINGFSRLDIFKAGIPIDSANHSWNAVKIDNNWRLLDLTWAHTTAVNKKYNYYYFFTPPEEFIANHFPEDEHWQLLSKPVNKKEFDEYPYVSGKYFEILDTSSFPKVGLLNIGEDTLKLSQIITPDYSNIVKVYSYDNKNWITPQYNISKSEKLIKIVIKKKGRYLVRIDYSRTENMTFELYKNVLSFTITKY